MTGFFLTFEGGEGSGKTTQVERLAEVLRASGWAVVVTREPGGTEGADAIRRIVLSGAAQRLGGAVEAVLFAAARADHVDGLISPALRRGDVVICDRFHDSTRVYQGLVPGADPDFLADLEEAALDGLYPDLTIILDLPATTGLARAAERRGGRAPDRFEKEDAALHEARRQAFLNIARREPARCVVVDAERPAADVAAEIATLVLTRLSDDLLATPISDAPDHGQIQ